MQAGYPMCQFQEGHLAVSEVSKQLFNLLGLAKDGSQR